MGRNLALLTLEVSSQGSTNRTAMEATMATTPMSLAGMNQMSKVIALRMA